MQCCWHTFWSLHLQRTAEQKYQGFNSHMILWLFNGIIWFILIMVKQSHSVTPFSSLGLSKIPHCKCIKNEILKTLSNLKQRIISTNLSQMSWFFLINWQWIDDVICHWIFWRCLQFFYQSSLWCFVNPFQPPSPH